MLLTFRRSVFRAGGIALFACVAMLSNMSPASAHGQGATYGGESTIDEQVTPSAPLCLRTSNNVTITLYNTGSFNDVSLVTHVAVFTADDRFYFSPTGTYQDALCSIPEDIEGSLSVGGHGSTATCTNVDATYQRVGTLYTITTTEETSCDVHGGGQDDHDSHLTYTGIQIPCGEPPFGVDCSSPNDPQHDPDIEFTGTYVQSGTD